MRFNRRSIFLPSETTAIAQKMQSFIKYFRISVLLCCNLNSLKDKKGFRGYLSLIQTHFPPHSDHIRPSLLNVLPKCALKRQFSYFKFMLLLPFLVVLIKSSDKREMAVTVSANNWHNLCPHFEPTLSHHESGAKQSFNSNTTVMWFLDLHWLGCAVNSTCIAKKCKGNKQTPNLSCQHLLREYDT